MARRHPGRKRSWRYWRRRWRRTRSIPAPTTTISTRWKPLPTRNALWQEVGRLAKEEGVTVFLTTQYLEEADVLADRIAIIDHGRIVATGTPEGLKAEIGRPTVEAVPAEPEARERLAQILARFGESVDGSPTGVAVRLNDSAGDLIQVVRALDAEGVEVANLQLHAPSLDDVFLAKTGRHLEGSGTEDEAAPEAE